MGKKEPMKMIHQRTPSRKKHYPGKIEMRDRPVMNLMKIGRISLYITIFVVSKKLEYGSRVVQKSNYRKQQKGWRIRFEMVLSWQNWQNLLRQMLNSEYLTKN